MGGFLFKRLKLALNNGEAAPSKRDFPLVKQNIVINSRADTYEDARTEWQLANIFKEGDDVDSFAGRCDLCNQGGLKLNFEIYNPYTSNRLMVGSSCIKRFMLLGGTGSVEQSWQYVVDKSYSIAYKKDLNSLLLQIFEDEPRSSDVSGFRKIAFRVLGWQTAKDINRESLNKLIDEMVNNNKCFEFGKYEKIERIKDIILNPKKVKTKRVRLETGQRDGHWASKGRRKARVNTTLSDSEAYKNH